MYFQHERAGERHGPVEERDEGVREGGGVLQGAEPGQWGQVSPRDEGVHVHGSGQAHRA